MSNHPEHKSMMGTHFGWLPSKPCRATRLLRAKLQAGCVLRGGHWWHPEPYSMLDWYCCQCGAYGQGMPRDQHASSLLDGLLENVLVWWARSKPAGARVEKERV